MKTQKNKIPLLLILPAIFAFSFFIGPENAQATCAIQSATFNPAGNKGDNWFKDATPPDVVINVVGVGCAGQVAEVSIVEDDTIGIDDDVAGGGGVGGV